MKSAAKSRQKDEKIKIKRGAEHAASTTARARRAHGTRCTHFVRIDSPVTSRLHCVGARRASPLERDGRSRARAQTGAQRRASAECVASTTDRARRARGTRCTYFICSVSSVTSRLHCVGARGGLIVSAPASVGEAASDCLKLDQYSSSMSSCRDPALSTAAWYSPSSSPAFRADIRDIASTCSTMRRLNRALGRLRVSFAAFDSATMRAICDDSFDRACAMFASITFVKESYRSSSAFRTSVPSSSLEFPCTRVMFVERRLQEDVPPIDSSTSLSTPRLDSSKYAESKHQQQCPRRARRATRVSSRVLLGRESCSIP